MAVFLVADRALGVFWVETFIVFVVIVLIVFHYLLSDNIMRKEASLLPPADYQCRSAYTNNCLFNFSDQNTFTALCLQRNRYKLMDLEWLWLIVPGVYFAISTFFLCFANILHKRQRYQYDGFNQLVQSDSLYCIGHRGGAFQGPQNTMQVFKITHKVSHMFQLDVVATKDNKLIVHHDVNLLRTCGVNRPISELNHQELPNMLEEYQSFGGGMVKTQRNKLLLLEDLFQQFPEMPMNIDLKTPTEQAILELDRLVRKFKREHVTVWGAIDSARNQRMREVNPEIVNFYSTTEILKVFFLCISGLLPFVCLRQGVLDIPLVTNQMKTLAYKLAGSGCKKCLVCVAMGLMSFFNFMSRLFISHLKKRGILTFYWIVNEQEDFQAAVATGCSGIMTDLPSNLARYLKSSKLYFEGSSTSL